MESVCDEPLAVMRFRAADKPCARSPGGGCSGFVGRISVDAASGSDRTLSMSRAWCLVARGTRPNPS
ncbi:conserved hypothetical protein [Xanthomonas phaseoli pv. phaseoli]|uniref:Uncharacterized protein n=1 Tax=Xanthomonas campestris pv. phaseoli TaxID=317013 RepID=A0A7Z7NF61_XANCH|nr:conserved hypothetical protein [Xanthomonas phaseoli pv. phaseoli]